MALPALFPIRMRSNTRRRVKGHHLVCIGTRDTILVHAHEVFRVAVIASAGAIVLMHNHPSGDPTHSEADIKVTRDLIRAGGILKIEALDHVIIGNPNRSLERWGISTLKKQPRPIMAGAFCGDGCSE